MRQRKSEDRQRKSEDRQRKSEDRQRKSEDRQRKSEDGSVGGKLRLDTVGEITEDDPHLAQKVGGVGGVV